jgi:hypothetical protein
MGVVGSELWQLGEVDADRPPFSQKLGTISASWSPSLFMYHDGMGFLLEDREEGEGDRELMS